MVNLRLLRFLVCVRVSVRVRACVCVRACARACVRESHFLRIGQNYGPVSSGKTFREAVKVLHGTIGHSRTD